MPLITITNPTPYRVAIPGVGSVNGGTSQQFVVGNAQYPDVLKALAEAQALQGVTFTSALTTEERAITAEASVAVDASDIPYAGPDLEATNIKASVDELAASSGGGGGVVLESVVFDTGALVAGVYDYVTLTAECEHASVAVVGVKVEMTAGDDTFGSPVIKAPVEGDIVGSGTVGVFNGGSSAASLAFDVGDVAYGPWNKSMGDIIDTSPIVMTPVDGVLTLLATNNAYPGYPVPDPVPTASFRITLLVQPVPTPVGW